MPRPTRNLLGMQFGKWTVIGKGTKGKAGQTKWLCECTCGNRREVYAAALLRGISRSCKQCFQPTITIDGDMVVYSTKHGSPILFDREDLELLRPYRWEIGGDGYPIAKVRSGRGSPRVKMHRLLMGEQPPEVEIDHINGNRRDCRKSNLRFASRHQNACNTGMRSNNTTGYKGVSWDKLRKKYVAHIKAQNKHWVFRAFDDPILAALEYDKAARRFFGEYARLNFPYPGYQSIYDSLPEGYENYENKEVVNA